MKNPKLTPPLKWAGGKQRLLPSLLPHIPKAGKLIEPFVGAGSVFLNAGEREIVINDANRDLVSMYEMLRDCPSDYITRAECLFTPEMHSQDAYLKIRRDFNASTDASERAVMLLYLNRFGFNGLYRVNKSGQYNVPYGRPTRIPAFPAEQLMSMAETLRGATITCGDFRETMELAGPGDVLYCDPPYASNTADSATFVGYTAYGFTRSDQQDLAKLAREASTRGATVIISNHDTPFVRELYAGMQLHTVEVRRSIAAGTAHRGKAHELIAVLAPTSPL